VGLVILIAIIIAVVANGGGGGSPSAVPTTEINTQPVTPNPTPSPQTTPTTTATNSSGLTVTIPADAGNISAGDSGPAVLNLQKALKQLGEDVGEPDGKFGQGTLDAVKAFQTAHGLTPDGIVGQSTVDAINSALGTGSGSG
jgi:peptidoglycan hydrolase-like protein with peptidoglycan-binding domain